MTAYPSFVFKT